MPIEIKELHIRVAVNTPSAASQPAGSVRQAPSQQADAGKKKDELIAECIEQILQIMENKNER
jgi:hypothetical protein